MLPTLLAVAALVVPQDPGAVVGQAAKGGGSRFVDFSDDLARPGVAVVLGTLGKVKEGKRERLPDGALGGAGTSVSVSGTQYFKVPATAPIEVRKELHGEAGKPTLQFEMQLARLPDGKERRQLRAGNNAEITEGAFGLFVIDNTGKGKAVQLLHLIPFQKGNDGNANEAAFVDSMSDVVAVNKHVLALKQALAAADAAKTDDDKAKTKKALQELVDHRPEMKRTENDGWLAMYVGPLEARAKKRLAG